MPKFYVIMKLTFQTVEDKAKFKKKLPCKQPKYDDTKDDGAPGTGGNPDNHFPSVRIHMHELNKAETDPLVLFHVLSTNY